jgi:hypothetical protein
MNERIRELMDQVDIDVEAVENLGEMPTALKFAELIVKECMEIVGDGTVDGEIYHDRIKRHFGVEE